MHLIPPSGSRKKFTIRHRIDGRSVKIPGDVNEKATIRIADRVLMLVNAKENGDPPPKQLAEWIDNMPDVLSHRLVELKLLSQRRVDRSRPFSEYIDDWKKIVQARRPNSKDHAPQQGNKVRRVADKIKPNDLADLDPDSVTEAINSFQALGCKKQSPLSTSTRRSYAIAMKDFTSWIAKKLKIADPLNDLELPGQYTDVEYERSPLTVKEFQKLMAYLDTFERYPHQKARWTTRDRKLIYWTAVRSAYRETEMKKFRKWNFYLDETPPVIGLKARDNKNKARGEVPIPTDLALALKKYVADLGPTDLVFPFPQTSGSIVDMLRRDLEGAGIDWKRPNGEVIDYHSFRPTCICWCSTLRVSSRSAFRFWRGWEACKCFRTTAAIFGSEISSG